MNKLSVFSELTAVIPFYGVVLLFCYFPTAQFGYFVSAPYTVKFIQGWTVHVENRLLKEKPLGQDVLNLLDNKLYEINRVVPDRALADLRRVPIWADLEAKKFPCAVYHPSADWLKENGFDPQKAQSVHIANATNFIHWTLDQPFMMLHELSHAYHHQVLGYDNPMIKQAYEHAVSSGSYDWVMRYNGQMQKAYALNNDQEYFAELSEAFFGTNDYYPFVRAEIMHHDPEMHEILKTVWKVSR
ncbi:MAG: hypothetical protein C4527_22370 [Candidatus Omnitrophota bacterium]|jgi:hypothetical protein|nr:MAG: hypothetical protein C4527_22370 [Candidatus Omnitrophota bacterium]